MLMNANRKPPAGPATQVHRSTRTAISENTDSATGARIQVLRTSELRMDWVGDSLYVRYSGTAISIDVDRARERLAARRTASRADPLARGGAIS